jgi:hypothetical protein
MRADVHAGGKAYPPEYALVFPLELQNLRDMIYESDWQPGWARILPIASQLASALAHLHGQEILHRWGTLYHDVANMNAGSCCCPAMMPGNIMLV